MTRPVLDPLAPCGYCRRCAIHDDPGGCLTVEAYAREKEEQMTSTSESGYNRFLIAGGPDECRYEIRNGVYRRATFTTAGVNGRTPDETAEGNLADFSEYHDGRLSLWRMKNEVETDELLAEAEHGCVYPVAR